MERGFARVVIGVAVGGDRPDRLPAQERRRGPRQRQGAVRREVRGLPRARSAPGRPASTGPDLDAAFAQARTDGLGESTFAGVVEQQILHPNINPQVDPTTGKTLPLMPAKLVEGDDARDVAAYVAQAAAKAGEDPGRLAAVGAQQAEGTAEAENGTLDIPVAAAGLAYQFADAEAPAGQLTVTSENPQSVAARHRGRGQRRRREGRDRARAAASRSSQPTCSPASTRSSAPCPATARAAWRASSPSSSPAPPARLRTPGARARRASPPRRRRARRAGRGTPRARSAVRSRD